MNYADIKDRVDYHYSRTVRTKQGTEVQTGVGECIQKYKADGNGQLKVILHDKKNARAMTLTPKQVIKPKVIRQPKSVVILGPTATATATATAP